MIQRILYLFLRDELHKADAQNMKTPKTKSGRLNFEQEIQFHITSENHSGCEHWKVRCPHHHGAHDALCLHDHKRHAQVHVESRTT